MRYHPLWQLTLGKLREFVREPEAIFWVIVFPILLALVLGIAFRSRGPDTIAIGVESGEGAASVARTLDGAPGLRAEVLEEADAREALRDGKVALVVVPGPEPAFRYDPTRSESRTARLAVDDALQRAAGRTDPVKFRDETVSERGSRYIDFLVPGLLGMNLMGTGMWGIGFAIVSARSKNLLKRLIATPMRRSHYLLGQMFGRMVFLVFEVGALVGFARWAFDVPFRGSIAAFAAVTATGALAFAGLGLLTASRARTTEGVSGLMNVVMLPMWMCSGVFFSSSRFPDFAQPAIRALPLTALNDALRALMLDGAPLARVAGEVAIVAAWGVAAFAAALYLFRWK